MKFFPRCYLSGCLLILITAAAFSQDSARKRHLQSKWNFWVPPFRKITDAVSHEQLKDSFPFSKGLGSSGTRASTEILLMSSDLVRHKTRHQFAAAGATGFSGTRRNGSGRQFRL
jgi:hypothetical protein